VRAALDALSELGNTLETAVRVFRILAEHLKIERGALLLPDPETGELAPWSMRGLDRTSEHRLRIPATELSEHVLDSAAAATILSGGRLRAIKPYFSQREFGSLSHVALVPFRSGNRLLGLLIVAASPYLGESRTVLDVAFSAVARPISTLLMQNRETRLHAARDRTILDESELQAMAAETPAPEEGNAVVVRFDIDGIVERVSGEATDVDRYRIRQDVLRVIAVMVAENVTIGTSAAGNVVLIFPSDAALAPSLVLHQISLKLSELFDEIDSPPDLSAAVRTVDHGARGVDEVLAELL
jgi:hypothetical protein